MRFRTNIFTVFLMLFVLSGQSLTVSGVSSCDMAMHDMNMIDHGSMDILHEDMNNNKMDCCDSSCAMDCGLSMVFAVVESKSFETMSTSLAKIFFPETIAINNLNSSLYHPPIFV